MRAKWSPASIEIAKLLEELQNLRSPNDLDEAKEDIIKILSRHGPPYSTHINVPVVIPNESGPKIRHVVYGRRITKVPRQGFYNSVNDDVSSVDAMNNAYDYYGDPSNKYLTPGLTEDTVDIMPLQTGSYNTEGYGDDDLSDVNVYVASVPANYDPDRLQNLIYKKTGKRVQFITLKKKYQSRGNRGKQVLSSHRNFISKGLNGNSNNIQPLKWGPPAKNPYREGNGNYFGTFKNIIVEKSMNSINELKKLLVEYIKKVLKLNEETKKSRRGYYRIRAKRQTPAGYTEDPDTCKKYNENLEKMWSTLSKYLNSTDTVNEKALHNIAVMIEAYINHQTKTPISEYVTRKEKKRDKISVVLKQIKSLLGTNNATDKVKEMVLENFKPSYDDADSGCRQINEDILTSSIAISYKNYLDNAQCHGDYDTGLLRGKKPLLRAGPTLNTNDNLRTSNFHDSENVDKSIVEEGETSKEFKKGRTSLSRRNRLYNRCTEWKKGRNSKSRRSQQLRCNRRFVKRSLNYLHRTNKDARKKRKLRKSGKKKKSRSRQKLHMRTDESCVKYANRKFLITLRTSIERFIDLRDCQHDDTLRTSSNKKKNTTHRSHERNRKPTKRNSHDINAANTHIGDKTIHNVNINNYKIQDHDSKNKSALNLRSGSHKKSFLKNYRNPKHKYNIEDFYTPTLDNMNLALKSKFVPTELEAKTVYDIINKNIQRDKAKLRYDYLARLNYNNYRVSTPASSSNEENEINFQETGDILNTIWKSALQSPQVKKLVSIESENEKGYVVLTYLVKYPKSIVYRPQYLVKNILQYDDFLKVADQFHLKDDDTQLLKIVRYLPDNRTQVLFETLQNYKSPVDIHEINSDNNSPIHNAMFSSSSEMLRQLPEVGKNRSDSKVEQTKKDQVVKDLIRQNTITEDKLSTKVVSNDLLEIKKDKTDTDRKETTSTATYFSENYDESKDENHKKLLRVERITINTTDEDIVTEEAITRGGDTGEEIDSDESHKNLLRENKGNEYNYEKSVTNTTIDVDMQNKDVIFKDKTSSYDDHINYVRISKVSTRSIPKESVTINDTETDTNNLDPLRMVTISVDNITENYSTESSLGDSITESSLKTSADYKDYVRHSQMDIIYEDTGTNEPATNSLVLEEDVRIDNNQTDSLLQSIGNIDDKSDVNGNSVTDNKLRTHIDHTSHLMNAKSSNDVIDDYHYKNNSTRTGSAPKEDINVETTFIGSLREDTVSTDSESIFMVDSTTESDNISIKIIDDDGKTEKIEVKVSTNTNLLNYPREDKVSTGSSNEADDIIHNNTKLNLSIATGPVTEKSIRSDVIEENVSENSTHILNVESIIKHKFITEEDYSDHLRTSKVDVDIIYTKTTKRELTEEATTTKSTSIESLRENRLNIENAQTVTEETVYNKFETIALSENINNRQDQNIDTNNSHENRAEIDSFNSVTEDHLNSLRKDKFNIDIDQNNHLTVTLEPKIRDIENINPMTEDTTDIYTYQQITESNSGFLQEYKNSSDNNETEETNNFNLDNITDSKTSTDVVREGSEYLQTKEPDFAESNEANTEENISANNKLLDSLREDKPTKNDDPETNDKINTYVDNGVNVSKSMSFSEEKSIHSMQKDIEDKSSTNITNPEMDHNDRIHVPNEGDINNDNNHIGPLREDAIGADNSDNREPESFLTGDVRVISQKKYEFNTNNKDPLSENTVTFNDNNDDSLREDRTHTDDITQKNPSTPYIAANNSKTLPAIRTAVNFNNTLENWSTASNESSNATSDSLTEVAGGKEQINEDLGTSHKMRTNDPDINPLRNEEITDYNLSVDPIEKSHEYESKNVTNQNVSISESIKTSLYEFGRSRNETESPILKSTFKYNNDVDNINDIYNASLSSSEFINSKDDVSLSKLNGIINSQINDDVDAKTVAEYFRYNLNNAEANLSTASHSYLKKLESQGETTAALTRTMLRNWWDTWRSKLSSKVKSVAKKVANLFTKLNKAT